MSTGTSQETHRDAAYETCSLKFRIKPNISAIRIIHVYVCQKFRAVTVTLLHVSKIYAEKYHWTEDNWNSWIVSIHCFLSGDIGPGHNHDDIKLIKAFFDKHALVYRKGSLLSCYLCWYLDTSCSSTVVNIAAVYRHDFIFTYSNDYFLYNSYSEILTTFLIGKPGRTWTTTLFHLG